MKRLLEWFSRPSLAVRLLQDENARLVAENRRLTDLLTQAWEQSRVVPRQPEHKGTPPPQPETRKTYGELQMEYALEEQRNYQIWKAAETERLSHVFPKDDGEHPAN